MTGDCHVRFLQGLGVKLPRPTKPCTFAASMRWLAALALAASASSFAIASDAETDPSFVLTATSHDLPTYFPTYLANGYFSTMTAPRGTESNLSYMVAFMDYTKEDIARPAAIPGWSGINYSTGRSTAGQFWLNDVRVGSQAFADYDQTLKMHDARLTTRYRYTDASGKSTRVEVVTFVSQASPHLAAIRMSITPEFSGTAQVSFPFLLWAPQEPRFPIRTMTGD